MNAKVVKKRIITILLVIVFAMSPFSLGFIRLPEQYFCWQASRSGDYLQALNGYLLDYCDTNDILALNIRKGGAKYEIKYYTSGTYVTKQISDLRVYTNLHILFLRFNVEAIRFNYQYALNIRSKAAQGITISEREETVDTDSVKRYKHVVDNVYYVEYKTTMDYEREKEIGS